MAKENPQQVFPSCECSTCHQHPQSARAREHRRINRLVAATDGRARRLLVGFVARQHGRGGMALLAQITGSDRHTTAGGRRELRQRRCLQARPAAGGRPPPRRKKVRGF